MYTVKEIAQSLDLTVLRPTARSRDILAACALVRKHSICAICVAPVYAQLAVQEDVPVCAVVGFPHGTSTPAQKRDEAMTLIDIGVQELDVVINYGRLLDGDSDPVEQELTAIVDFARLKGVTVKAILETCYYTTPALESTAIFCAQLGVNFVETSSGYGLHGANPRNITTLLQAVEPYSCQVKASGGITNYNDAAKFLDLGCARLGACRFKELLA